MNPGTFFIESLIVHDVPRHGPGASKDEIVYSDVASPLNQELKNFFRERVIRSLAGYGYAVERDPLQSSPVPDHVAAIITNPSSIVDPSQRIAEHLWSSQPAVSPPGLLVVCTGTVDGEPAMSIMKLDREDAIRVQPTGDPGAKTFTIAHLQDLMLGKNTRVFKASLFVLASDGGDQIEGLVSDEQRGYDPTSEVARFFLRRFLGCQLKTVADVATKAFFEQSQVWVNNNVEDEGKKADYGLALLAYINSPGKDVSVKSFAEQFLDVDDRKSYKDHMTAQGVPTTAIHKDARLIESFVKQLTLATQHNVRITATEETMRQYVDVEGDGADGPTITIRDGLKGVRGGGR